MMGDSTFVDPSIYRYPPPCAPQNYGIRRRLRRAIEWFQRNWPIWTRQFEEFTSTPVGKFIAIGGFVLLMTTPIFWRVRTVQGAMQLSEIQTDKVISDNLSTPATTTIWPRRL